MSRSHAVVIATALADVTTLRRVLDAVHRQTRRVADVVVVAAVPPPELGVRTLQATRAGISTQRNVGLEAVAADVVHVVDDDVLLDADYVARIDSAYDDAAVVGATGNLSWDSLPSVVSRRTRPLLPGRPAPGRMNRAGVTEPIDLSRADHDVGWMPGGAMSMRTDLAHRLRFDEILERGPTGGYALFEDAELTRRLSFHGRMRFVAGARARHLGRPAWRLGWPAYWEMRALGRRYLAGKAALGLSPALAWTSLSVDLALVTHLVATGRAPAACLAAFARGVAGPSLDRRPVPCR